MSKFKRAFGDWRRLRRPGCKEVDLHFEQRDRSEQSYDAAMAEVATLVEHA
jgi:hypothetical protein